MIFLDENLSDNCFWHYCSSILPEHLPLNTPNCWKKMLHWRTISSDNIWNKISFNLSSQWPWIYLFILEFGSHIRAYDEAFTIQIYLIVHASKCSLQKFMSNHHNKKHHDFSKEFERKKKRDTKHLRRVNTKNTK